MTPTADTDHQHDSRPVALVTGASAGLGLALARGLAARGWALILDGRGEAALHQVATELGQHTEVRAIPGDVAASEHREQLAAVVGTYGRLDALVNNASTLGPAPLPPLAAYPLDEFERVLQVNTVAPLGLAQLLLPMLSATRGAMVNISSDAAVEAYPGWGGYGAAKAALDQLSAVLAVEQPAVRVYGFDPGDMRTAMHQRAYPGEDICDRPTPERVVPALIGLLVGSSPSGRYRVDDLLADPAGHS